MHLVLLLLLLPLSTTLSFNPSDGWSARQQPRPLLNLQDTTTPPNDLSELNDVDRLQPRTSLDLQLLKEEILEIAARTNRGFAASNRDQQRARDVIFSMAKYNPTLEPANSYYPSNAGEAVSQAFGPTLAGKWTLLYTDAPDITSLEQPQQQQGFLQLPRAAKLGRIGQQCEPPYIQNVIEWCRPEWATNLPLASGPTRVLQKVVTEAVASPAKPKLVQLKLVGFDLLWLNQQEGDKGNTVGARDGGGFFDSALGFLKNPLQTRLPVAAPFGEFEVLFLDDEMRAIRTGQNFLAVSVRDLVDWF